MNSKVFISGPVSSDLIARSIQKHQLKTNIGAHDIFLGQVRADMIGGKQVIGIEYEAYVEMAERKVADIREHAFQKYNLTCLHIFHSLGKVRAGEICFFVFASAHRRKQVFIAIEDVVDKVKEEVPIFGREMVGEDEYYWKRNA